MHIGASPRNKLQIPKTTHIKDPTGIVEKGDLVSKVAALAAAGPAVAVSARGGGAGGGVRPTPAGYAYDAASGYFYGAEAGLYWDPKSGGFWDAAAGAWRSSC